MDLTGISIHRAVYTIVTTKLSINRQTQRKLLKNSYLNKYIYMKYHRESLSHCLTSLTQAKTLQNLKN